MDNPIKFVDFLKSHLQVFLDAYTFARRELNVTPTEEEQNFENFQEWIEKRFNQVDTQSWSRIILFYTEDEADALELFFKLFEEFLQHDKSLDKNTKQSDYSISTYATVTEK